MESDTADAVGNKGVKVLSTPALLKYIENGSSKGLFNRLPEGYSPVGIRIDLEHIAATPVKAVIQVTSKVINIQGKKLHMNLKYSIKRN